MTEIKFKVTSIDQFAKPAGCRLLWRGVAQNQWRDDRGEVQVVQAARTDRLVARAYQGGRGRGAEERTFRKFVPQGITHLCVTG